MRTLQTLGSLEAQLHQPRTGPSLPSPEDAGGGKSVCTASSIVGPEVQALLMNQGSIALPPLRSRCPSSSKACHRVSRPRGSPALVSPRLNQPTGVPGAARHLLAEMRSMYWQMA